MRHRAEEAIRESETRYRAMVEAFDGLIYICSQNFRAEIMNQRFIERTLKISEQIAALVEKINVYISTKAAPLTIERLKPKGILQLVSRKPTTETIKF